jgi:secretion/DNA translocation related TadE-like protein
MTTHMTVVDSGRLAKATAPRSRLPGGERAPLMRPREEGGSVTVVVVAAIGVALILLMGGLALASAVIATHRARAAADLGALAAAQAIQRGLDTAEACAIGTSVTARNGAQPVGCAVAADGSVTSRATTRASFGVPWAGGRSTTATARAGPLP